MIDKNHLNMIAYILKLYTVVRVLCCASKNIVKCPSTKINILNSRVVAFHRAQKTLEVQGPTPSPLALEMDMHASKAVFTGL
jgi:hypothetical protein